MARRRKPPVPDAVREKREKELYEFYYQHEDELKITQYDKYHFRLWYKGNMLDVWPVSLTCYNQYMGKSKHYDNAHELMRYLKNEPKLSISVGGTPTVPLQ